MYILDRSSERYRPYEVIPNGCGNHRNAEQQTCLCKVLRTRWSPLFPQSGVLTVCLWFCVVGLWFVVVGLWFFVVGCWFFFAVQNRKNCKHVIKNIRRWAKTDNIPLKTCNIMQPTSKNQRTPTKNMQHGDAGGGMLHNTHSWVLQVGYTMCAG